LHRDPCLRERERTLRGPLKTHHKNAGLLFALLLLTAIGSGEHSPPVRIIKRPTDLSLDTLTHRALHRIALACPCPIRTRPALRPQVGHCVNYVLGPAQPLRCMPSHDMTSNERARLGIVDSPTAHSTRQLLPLQPLTVTAIPRRRQQGVFRLTPSHDSA